MVGLEGCGGIGVLGGANPDDPGFHPVDEVLEEQEEEEDYEDAVKSKRGEEEGGGFLEFLDGVQ